MPRLYGRDFTRHELMRHFGDAAQVFGVVPATLADGVERGVRVLRFRAGNGVVFDILVDRGFDLGSLEYRGAALGFQSPTGFRSPWLHDADAEDGLGFLRSFSGLLNTCGLDHVMAPETESADHYNYPFRKTISHGMHGRIAFTPARLGGYGTRWDGDRCFLWAEGAVVQATMFAENLHLIRRVEIEVGTHTIHLRDRVENRGFHRTPHMMLYHVNLAWPVLDAGSRVHLPVRATPWANHDRSAAEIGPWDQPGPQSNFREQVYEHDLAAGPDGIVPVAIVNPGFAWDGGGTGLGFMMEYDAAQLPAFYQWQNLQEGNYAMGLEPATVHAGTRADRRERGEIRWLGAGEGCDYDLRLTVLPDAGAVAAAVERIDGIRAGAG
jgi:Domain of unknown function (DUF4432)